MQSIRLPYSTDSFGNPLYAKIAFLANHDSQSKPIALVYHGGGLIVGSSEIVPKPQIEYLASKGFVVVVPNYRLAPQVTAKQAFDDAETAYDWATTDLVKTLQQSYGIALNVESVTTMGHSSGGTLAMHIGSCRQVKAITALYPSLYLSDTTSSSHKPTNAPPFGSFPDFHPTEEDWKQIKPADHQISEAVFPTPGTMPPSRTKWQMHVLKHGQWPSVVLPDGDFALIDPMTRITPSWPATMIIAGEVDKAPGSELALQQRAEQALKAVGVKEVQLVMVAGETHMFDLPPTVGTSDRGPKWVAVVKGMDWLASHA